MNNLSVHAKRRLGAQRKYTHERNGHFGFVVVILVKSVSVPRQDRISERSLTISRQGREVRGSLAQYVHKFIVTVRGNCSAYGAESTLARNRASELRASEPRASRKCSWTSTALRGRKGMCRRRPHPAGASPSSGWPEFASCSDAAGDSRPLSPNA